MFQRVKDSHVDSLNDCHHFKWCLKFCSLADDQQHYYAVPALLHS